jgi:hypothetical protein
MQYFSRNISRYFHMVYFSVRSPDSIASIAMAYSLDDQGVGVQVPVGPRIFSSPCHPHRLWSPPNLLSNGYRGAPSLGVKRTEREADHSLPTSAEVKENVDLYIHSPICLHGIVLN